MSQFLSSNELFINIKNPPKWNPKKDFFDQSIDVLDFYLEEKKKITDGITIGGYFIHPLLYWHMNYFKTPIPVMGKNKSMSEDIMLPPLDDNFLYFIESYKEAQDNNLGLTLFGSRGYSKSTILSSLITWLNTTKVNGTTSIIGGSEPDLKAISKLLSVGFNNVNPAMFIPQLISEWDSNIELGIKEKDGFRLPYSHISIVNANKGTSKSSEKGAGLSPVGFIIDEALHEDSLILTPTGKVKMKDVSVGDYVLNERNEKTRVKSKINPGIVDTWNFEFINGADIISSENHRWKIFIEGNEIHTTTKEILLKYYKEHDIILFPHVDGKLVELTDISYSGIHQVYCIGVECETETFLTESGIVTRNCGKFECKKILQSALPSFQTQYGSKLVPLLSGTSGNAELSKDAKDILSNPEAFKMLPMNWDRLDRRVDPESVTWERSRKEKFSMFVPGQMSYRLPVPKVKTDLATYFGVDNPILNKIEVNETDWKHATNYIQAENAAYLKEEDREKNRMYYPLEIADVFLTTASNPFPTALIDSHIRKLEDTGVIGKNVELYKFNGILKSEFSSKKRSAVSHGGGLADAPIIVFGEVPETPPEKFIYVSGLDDYKIEQSDTSSLGAMYVLKRRGLSIDSPCETIVASYVGRPNRHVDLHVICETLIEGWNALCCIEAIDISLQAFLENKKKAEQCLAPAMSFSNTSLSTGKYSGNSKYGIFPTKQNNDYMFDLVIDYCNEPHVVGIDESGNEIIKYGVEYIEDIDLLKEMLTYKKGGNFDRISAFKQALTYARELDKLNVRPKDPKKNQNTFKTNQPKVKMQVFGSRRPSPF